MIWHPACLSLLVGLGYVTAQTTITAEEFSATKFDYVVIGAGPGGLTVASRLAENSNVKVGVIEAGNFIFGDPIIDTPGNIGIAGGNPKYDWGFKTVPQPALNGGEVPANRGKLVGGTSGINFLAWTRASKVEYDALNAFAPGTSWNWNGLASLFERSSSSSKGKTSVIKSDFASFTTEPTPKYVTALGKLGVPTIADQNGGNTAGVYKTRITINGGKRSWATEYYLRSQSKSNFRLLSGALAEKIFFTGSASARTATGVRFNVNSRTFVVNATKEVIISAGTYQTPQLLELSGIGNAKSLKALGIASVVDLPQVGENLQEHLFSGASFEVKPGVRTFDELRNNATFAAEQATLYTSNGTGALASTDTTLAFLPSRLYFDTAQAKTSLAQFDAAAKVVGAKSGIQKLGLSLQRAAIQSGSVAEAELILFTKGLFVAEAGKSYVTILAGSMHPVARGSVHIKSASASDSPAIDPTYLTNDYDQGTILGALKFVLKLAKTAPLADIIQTQVVPSPALTSDADLISFIKASSQSGGHPLGTAALGPRDAGGVVDANLKVYGTTNLRVVDASIIPIQLGAHIQATVYAIGEKAADIIKGKAA